MDDDANNDEEKVKDDITGHNEAEIKEEGYSMNEDKTRTIVYKLTLVDTGEAADVDEVT